jgi:hypothetical protein
MLFLNSRLAEIFNLRIYKQTCLRTLLHKSPQFKRRESEKRGFWPKNGLFQVDEVRAHFLEPAPFLASKQALNNHRLKAGGFELRTESPDTRRLNDAS